MKYEHGLSFNILLKSENEFPKGSEIFQAIEDAMKELNEHSILDAVEIFDSIEVNNENE